MQQIIDDLQAIPGVIGASIYSSNDGLRHNNLPAMFRPEKLNETGKHLVKIYVAGRINFPDLNEVLVSYEESLMVCRQLSGKDYLMAICDPAINMNLLNMSLNLAIDNHDTQGDISPAKAATSPPPTPGPLPDPVKLREEGALAEPLQAMLVHLTKVIGPMALIVFDDCVALWASDAAPSVSRITDLQERICRDIGEKDKVDDFRKLLKRDNQLNIH